MRLNFQLIVIVCANIYGLIDTGKVILITTTLLQEVFTQRNFVADFIRLKLTFIQKTKKSPFVWYQNICSASFGFVTKHMCDRQTQLRQLIPR